MISRVTDGVMDDVREWQQRPLDDVYPVLFLDALVLKIREGGTVQRKAATSRFGVTVEGDRDVLGMWFQETEGAKFWMQVLTDLKQRGVQDILICCVDGLKGFPEAIEAIYPQHDGADLHRPLRRPPGYADSGSGGVCGGGDRAGEVGIIRVLRGTRACCRAVGSGRGYSPSGWCGRPLAL